MSQEALLQFYIARLVGRVFRRHRQLVKVFGSDLFTVEQVQEVVFHTVRGRYDKFDSCAAAPVLQMYEQRIEEIRTIRNEGIMLEVPYQTEQPAAVPRTELLVSGMPLGGLRRRKTAVAKQREVDELEINEITSENFDEEVLALLNKWQTGEDYPFRLSETELQHFFDNNKWEKVVSSVLIVCLSILSSGSFTSAMISFAGTAYLMLIDAIHAWKNSSEEEKKGQMNFVLRELIDFPGNAEAFMRKFMSVFVSVTIVEKAVRNNLEKKWSAIAKQLGLNYLGGKLWSFASNTVLPSTFSALSNFQRRAVEGFVGQLFLEGYGDRTGEQTYKWFLKGFAACDTAISMIKDYVKDNNWPKDPETQRLVLLLCDNISLVLKSIQLHVFGIVSTSENRIDPKVFIKIAQFLWYVFNAEQAKKIKRENKLRNQKTQAAIAEANKLKLEIDKAQTFDSVLPASPEMIDILTSDSDFKGLVKTTNDPGTFKRVGAALKNKRLPKSVVTGWNIRELAAYAGGVGVSNEADDEEGIMTTIAEAIMQIYPSLGLEVLEAGTQLINIFLQLLLIQIKNLSPMKKNACYCLTALAAFCFHRFFLKSQADAPTSASTDVTDGFNEETEFEWVEELDPTGRGTRMVQRPRGKTSQQIERSMFNKMMGYVDNVSPWINLIAGLGSIALFGAPFCDVQYDKAKCYGVKFSPSQIACRLGVEKNGRKSYVCQLCCDTAFQLQDRKCPYITDATLKKSLVLLESRFAYQESNPIIYVESNRNHKHQFETFYKQFDRTLIDRPSLKIMLKELQKEVRPIVCKGNSYRPSAFINLVFEPVSVGIMLFCIKNTLILSDKEINSLLDKQEKEPFKQFLPLNFWILVISKTGLNEKRLYKDKAIDVDDYETRDKTLYNVLAMLFKQIENADKDEERGKIENGYNEWYKYMMKTHNNVYKLVRAVCPAFLDRDDVEEILRESLESWNRKRD